MREDLRKLDDITAETRLLVRNRIDTAEQLFFVSIRGKRQNYGSDRRAKTALQIAADGGGQKQTPKRRRKSKAEYPHCQKSLPLCERRCLYVTI